MAVTSQIFTITPLDTTSAAFDISADDLISVVGINSNAASTVNYVKDCRETTTIDVNETPTVLSTNSGVLFPATLLSDGSTININAERVKKVFVNGTGSEVLVDTEESTWQPYYFTETAAAIVILINAIADTEPVPLAQHIVATTNSTSVASGALIVDGGVGIVKDVFIGGLTNIAGQVQSAATTDSTTSTTGAIKTAGGIGVAKAIVAGTTITATTGLISDSVTELTSGNGITMKKNLVNQKTLTALNTSGTVTAAIINKGGITSTSAAGVTATLDTAANIGTQIGAADGTSVDFVVDNTAGANTVTVAVAAGITVCSGVVTGSDTLTVSVANAIGLFRLIFSSATVAKLYRIG